MHEVFKKNMIKWIDVVPMRTIILVALFLFCSQKRWYDVVPNENNYIVPVYLVMGFRVFTDYHKLNYLTKKNHFSIPLMDQMFDRLSGGGWYSFLHGYLGYFEICIAPED